MPGTDLPLEKLRLYRGCYPRPTDFEAFWRDVKRRIDQIQLYPRLERQAFDNPHAAYYRVLIEAPDGSILQAKYIRPVTDQNVPCVLQLHDYPAASRGWFHLTRYIAIGAAVLAPECRGQGGYSDNHSSYAGPLAYGPMFNGLEGSVDQLYLFRLVEDALLWAKVMQKLDGIDVTQLSAYGEGQGGGLAIACAAMYPKFQKCAAHYPLLCDYKRVWDMDFDIGLYEGLRYFFRWHDPLHRREREVFDKLAYVDAKNFAPLVKARTLISTGLQDMVSPPSAQFAVFNNLETDKQHLVYPKHGHELNNFFENELLKFLLK